MLRDEGSYADQEQMKSCKRPDSLIVLPKTVKSRCKAQTKMGRRMAKEYKQPRHNETSAEDKPKHQAAHKTHESQILHNNSTRRTESGWENMRKAKFTKMADIEKEYNHKK